MADLIDLLDTSIKFFHRDQVFESSGFVLRETDNYIFGKDAEKSIRKKPYDLNNKFWWKLGTEPLNPKLGNARHTADLAHRHLISLSRNQVLGEKIVLAVPDSFSHHQLSLLLGIIAETPFEILGLIHRSALLAAPVACDESLLHLEIQLHQTSIVELVSGGEVVSVIRSNTIPGLGWLQLKERFAAAIGSVFVTQTRFDPIRQAHTDQLLYDKLPSILAHLSAESEMVCEIDGHTAQISAADLRPITEELIVKLKGVHKDLSEKQILLEKTASALPGINQLSKITFCETLDPLLVNTLNMDPNAPRVITDVPLTKARTKRNSNSSCLTLQKESRPTHWVDENWIAHPLKEGKIDEQINIYLDGVEWYAKPSAGLTCNSHPVENRPLSAGDRLKFQNHSMILINVPRDP